MPEKPEAAVDTKHTAEALAALAHEHRLAIHRMLVKQGPDGRPAGVIDLGLHDPALSDDPLPGVTLSHPILINRPFASMEKGVRLCRPSKLVLDILPPQRGAFAKQDGEPVTDAEKRRVTRGDAA